MESRDSIDSIKAEKADALARYRRFTNITKLFQFIEVFVAVALISWSSTRLPSVFKFSGEYVSAFSSYFMNQHVVFLVGNVIVVVCYVLSRYSDSGTDSADYGIYSDDGTYSQLTHRKMNSDASNAQVTGASSESENKNPKSIVKSESELATGTKIKQAAKQIERFQRTKSDKLKSQIPVKRHRELRRSVTEMRRSMTVTSGAEESTAKSFQAVEKLSNEEFRIAVETFISKQQRFLKQQSMVEDDT
ncbi:hypothetical protein L1987_14037 [Smallanthus sonchifolius]|uniref:Uncharacterized protein n=1 Tax=Smallanthus sonchifolius TaxID=185202 RepID=A0ACB9JI68_9ASTR|nr:hypothetical protein L1987_14037 [Smallanthus sonchifolius]